MKKNRLGRMAAVGFLTAIFGIVGIQAEESAVAEKLKGKIIQVQDGEVAEAALAGSPEFYVLYHSASW